MTEHKEQQNNHSESSTPESSYIKQYEQEQQSYLDNGAPELTALPNQGVNKKALIFVGLTGLCLLGFGAFAYHLLTGGDEEKPVESTQGQIVNVPDLPPPMTPPVEQSAPPAQQATQGIPLSQETIALPPQSAEPVPMTPPPQSFPEQYAAAPVGYPAYPVENQENSILEMRKSNTAFVEEGDNASESRQNAAAVRVLPNRDKLLIQGTYLRCVLESKIITDVPGFTSCIITEPVYSANGRSMLIPKGSKVMGQYGSSSPTGPRLGVIWDRIITPDGLDISLKSPGVDNLGAAGHMGNFRSHWPSRFASALLISMISDAFKYAASEHGKGSTTTSDGVTETNPYESESADTLKQMAINQLERNNARPNTVTINQGTLINIYTAQDIDFGTVIQ